jgi:ATP-dependent exoDNAse (exonuclease V) alpha subunit
VATLREAATRGGYSVHGLAPTSRAAVKLAEAGLTTSTLQHHLARGRDDGDRQRLYVLDEAGLAGTRQLHGFLHRLTNRDRVIFVGDVRQHEPVEAGRPYHQLQLAGLAVARLDHIVRQRDAALKAVVARLARGEVHEAIQDLDTSGRIYHLPDRNERLNAIATEYARDPERTLVVSPDHESRHAINQRIHEALQATGAVAEREVRMSVLVPRQDLTGPDRQWAQRYQRGEFVRYSCGSRALLLAAGDYAQVEAVHAADNLLTVKHRGVAVTYDPRRLQGVTVYREAEVRLALGDRVQITAPDRARHVANRELGTVARLERTGHLDVRLDSGQTVSFNINERPHLDYGYAVTSHSSQGQTADRVLVHVETVRGETLVNRRFAYVAISRGQYDVRLYTDNQTALARALARTLSHVSAIETTGTPHRDAAAHEQARNGRE